MGKPAKKLAVTPQALRAAPWARVQRVQLVRREVREYLPASVVQLLLSRAECVVEGGDEMGNGTGSPGRRVYATVMITIDLQSAGHLFRERADQATALRVAELLRTEPALANRLVELARPELSRIATGPQGRNTLEISVEHQVRTDGARILVDGDAMAVVTAQSRAN